jgi:hypothetical protein
LSESLFLNFVSYENERLGAYLRKLGQAGVGPQIHVKTAASPRKQVKKGAPSRAPVRKRRK